MGESQEGPDQHDWNWSRGTLWREAEGTKLTLVSPGQQRLGEAEKTLRCTPWQRSEFVHGKSDEPTKQSGVTIIVLVSRTRTLE